VESLKFVKYRITWKFTDEGYPQEATFYLPDDKDPFEEVSALINLVELSASEYGYAYQLWSDCRHCGKEIDLTNLDYSYNDMNHYHSCPECGKILVSAGDN